MLSALLVAVVLTGMIGIPAASGQSEGFRGKDNLYHWAYAAAFGTGAYRIGDEKTVVVTIDPKYRLATVLERPGMEVNLTAPLSIGLQTIDPDEFLGRSLPDNFTTVSLVPGIEVLFPVGSRWTFKPFVNAGWGTELAGDQSAWIYFGGIKSRYAFDWNTIDFGLLNGLQWYGYSPNGSGSDAFGQFLAGLEADFPLGDARFRAQQLYLRPHILYFWYFNQIDFDFFQDGFFIDQELELAMAVGTKQLARIGPFRLDRIGIGYRVSPESEGIRFFLQSAFD